MDVLYDDVLSHILSKCYIKDINLVCKKWKKIAYNQSSRNRTLSIKLFGKKYNRNTVGFFVELLSSLENFKGKFEDVSIKHIFQHIYIDLIYNNLKYFQAKNLIIKTDIKVNKNILNYRMFENIKLVNGDITISSNITLPKNLYLYYNTSLYIKGKVQYKGIEKIFIIDSYNTYRYLRYKRDVFPDLKCFNISLSCDTQPKFSILHYNIFYSCVMDTDISLEIDEESMNDELKEYLKTRSN